MNVSLSSHLRSGCLLICYCLGLLFLTGYSAHAITEADQQVIVGIGKEFQREGIMSQKDYIIVRQVLDSVRQTGSISTRDLDWSLSLLTESPTSVGRARIMGMLSIVKRGDNGQKQKILNAITPLLKSKDELDYLYAARVQRGMKTFVSTS